MTDVDDPPDLERLDVDDSVRVFYESDRTGNEVDRRGDVAFTTSADDGALYWVHTDQRSPLKHQFLALSDAETKGGDSVVIAQSVTVAADPPNDGDPPRPGTTHVITFSVGRTSFLGIVDRVMRDGVNINVRGIRT